MISFATLYKAVMKNEAGFNPNDQGARAYNGINEHYHPKWSGWAVLNKKGVIKRGTVFPELEGATQDFYQQYWKDMGLDTSKVNDLKVAILLVDMCTQHGRWATIVNAGLYAQPLFDAAKKINTKIPNRIGDAEYRTMNTAPAVAYKKIADARVVYSTNIGLSNEADRKGIIARAKAFANDATAYLAAHPVATGSGVALVGFALFFFI